MPVSPQKAFENLIRDVGIAEDEQKPVIDFLKFLEPKDRYHAEEILKKTITFMKVHGDKLKELTTEDMHGVYETLLEERKKRSK